MTALDTYVLIMSCEVVCFLQNNVLSNLFQPLLQSSQKKRKFSKDMRRINSRIPNSRSWDFPWQGYKEPSLRMEGSLQWNQPLTIWYISGFVTKLIKLWWPWHLNSITFERTVVWASVAALLEFPKKNLAKIPTFRGLLPLWFWQGKTFTNRHVNYNCSINCSFEV